MRANKLIVPAALLLAAGLAEGVSSWQESTYSGSQAELGNQAADDAALASCVDKRTKNWQPTSAERRLDEIGWAKDLRDALKLAKENGRPVFLFTYSGSAIRNHAIAGQRC
jgi:hypothetical protein